MHLKGFEDFLQKLVEQFCFSKCYKAIFLLAELLHCQIMRMMMMPMLMITIKKYERERSSLCGENIDDGNMII